MTTVSELDNHIENFSRLDGGVPAGLTALRERGLARFTESGYPTTRLEDWKYTNLAPLTRQTFRLGGADAASAAAPLATRAGLDGAIQLVFVNGHFAADLSTLAALPNGVVVASLADAVHSHGALIEPHLGQHAAFDQADASLAALNTAFIRDGVFIHAPAGAVVETPIHCLFVSLTANGATVTHPRTLIVAGENSRLTVIEQYVGDGAYWTNAVTEAVVGPGANLAHYRVQREDERAYHIGVVSAAQAADSRFASHAVSLGAGLARNDVTTRLDAPGAACTFDGLYLAHGAQHVDHHTTIDHREPRGTSRELYKGIMDGRATGVFNGKVFVRPQAQQSDAQQMNKNLLLSDDAQIETKPQLEIFADDVKCSHGATIGQLDDNGIFYLRARGIDAPTARQMLIFAFANELVDRIEVAPLRDHLTRELEQRLRNETT